MPEIVKTEAIVLNKIDYGDSSKIVSLYTKGYGRLSAIAKGAKSSKSRMGRFVDILNYIQVILYKKDNREIQLITQADLISHYSTIKSDLNKVKYASAVLELVYSLTPEREENTKIFRGIVRIFSLMETSKEHPGILLLKFILFFIKETGFELQIEKCVNCKRELDPFQTQYFNFEKGIFCEDCSKEFLVSYKISPELFNLFLCLRNKQIKTMFVDKLIDNAIIFLDKYIRYHMPEFKGINSIKLF